MQLESHPILLELLQEFDAICRKHDIQYFLSAGTRLGAMRHGGFIPWDDDADVILPLEDYKKLLNVIKQELKPGRGYYDANLAPYTWRRAHGRYTNLNTTYYAKHQAFLNLDFGCRLDVFVQLPVPDHDAMRQEFIAKVRDWYNFLYLPVAKYHPYSAWRYLYFQILGVLLGRDKVNQKLFDRLTLPAGTVTSRYLEAYEPRDSIFNADSFDHQRYVQFENVELPVPRAAEYTLEERFGDWRKLPPTDKQTSHHGGTQDCKRPYQDYADDFMSYIKPRKWARCSVMSKFFGIAINKLERKGSLRILCALLKRLRMPYSRYIARQMLIAKRPEVRFALSEILLPQKDLCLKLLDNRDFAILEGKLQIYIKHNRKFLAKNIPFCFDKDFYQILSAYYKWEGRKKEYSKMQKLENAASAYLLGHRCDSPCDC